MRYEGMGIRRRAGAVVLLLVASGLGTPAAAQCVGDCNVAGRVTVDELIVGVNIALGNVPVAQCQSLDADGSGTVSIGELVQAVDNALQGCPAVPDSAGIVFNAENNRLHAYKAGPSIVRQTVVPSNGDAPGIGRDVNGQICFHRDADGLHFIAGEDTNQGAAHVTAGWGYFNITGTQVGDFGYEEIGKLIPTYQPTADEAENYGCGFLGDGRLLTTDVGNQATGDANGQLIIWFGPFDTGAEYTDAGVVPTNPAHYCKLDVGIGTAQQIAVDAQDRIYVGSARGDSSGHAAGVYRYVGPFPTSDTPDGGCDGTDNLGSPMATHVNKALFIPSDSHITTPSGVVIKPNGGFYVSSVLNGTIAEYDMDGMYVRTIMTEPQVVFPALYGSPLGIGLGPDGTIYYADIGLRSGDGGIGPGARTGAVRRVRFVDGIPQTPEILDNNGLDFPDGIGMFPSPSPATTPTPTPVPTPRVYVYWDQNEEEDAIAPGGHPVQLVAPWDPNGQMCIFPDSSGRPGQFVTGYNPTLPSQNNLGGLLPYKNPPVGMAVWDRHGGYTGQNIFVPGSYAFPGGDIGGDIPPDEGSTFCTDGHTSGCQTDADCPNGSKCSGTFNNNGSYTGCAFDSKGDLFAADIGQGQGSALPPDQGRIIEWFPPDYTSYCIIYGPNANGTGPHHVNGNGGLRQPGMMTVDPQDNLYVPVEGTGAQAVLPAVLKFDHTQLPGGPADCGPDGLLTPEPQPTVFIHPLAPANVKGLAVPQGIARDPTCSTSTTNCWAVSNVTSGTTIGQDTAAVYWFDGAGNPMADKGPIPKGDYNPFGLAISPTGDVYFISIGLMCSGAQCDTVDDGGALFEVPFSDGAFSTPRMIANGMNFPTNVTLCDADTRICPVPVLTATPVVQPTGGPGGG